MLAALGVGRLLRGQERAHQLVARPLARLVASQAEELAAAAGIGKNTVNRLERDLTEPRPPTLRKLARALDVDPAELVGD